MTARFIAALLLFTTMGCYNIVIINVGVGNKEATALAAPLDEQEFCDALTGQPQKSKILSIEKLCGPKKKEPTK